MLFLHVQGTKLLTPHTNDIRSFLVEKLTLLQPCRFLFLAYVGICKTLYFNNLD